MEVPEPGQRRMSLRELEKEAGGVAESNQELKTFEKHVPHVPAGTETSDSHRGLANKQRVSGDGSPSLILMKALTLFKQTGYSD